MTSVGSRLIRYGETMLAATPGGGRTGTARDDFGTLNARLARYEAYWGFYENTIYIEDIHWYISAELKRQRGLYKHTRAIYNPAARIVDFWADKLMGGGLDPKAGNGEDEQSCLPIITDNEGIRKPIARLWADSLWAVQKDTYARFGACYGDVGLMIEDLPGAKQVRLKVVTPASIAWVDRDPETDEIIGYIIEETRPDPRVTIANGVDAGTSQPIQTGKINVTYREVALLDRKLGVVGYATSLDGEPYAWNGRSASWSIQCPFVPMVLVQHESIGLSCGLNCFHGGTGRFSEVDDQGSGLSDQIRKVIRAPKLLSGMKAPTGTIRGQVSAGGATASESNPEPDRQELAYIYGPEGARAHDLYSNLDISGVIAHIRALLDAIELMYPELKADIDPGDTSGRAIQAARQVASSKVQTRRAAYDDGLVRAHRMAIALGGERGYRGYEGFNFASLDGPDLDHRIGHREVFMLNPHEELELENINQQNIALAVANGIPLAFYLKQRGLSDEYIEGLEAAREKAATEAQAQAQVMGLPAPGTLPDGSKPPGSLSGSLPVKAPYGPPTTGKI